MNVAQNELRRGANIAEVKVFDDGRFGALIGLGSRLDRPTGLRFLADGFTGFFFSDDGMMKLAA